MLARRRPPSRLACLALALAASVHADAPVFEVLPEDVAAAAGALRDEALESSDAHGFVAGLTTEVGPRPAGSVNDAKAVAWAAARLRSYGLEVHTEEVTVPHWVRGAASGRILAPYPHRVELVALGGSVGTPEGGVEAEVIEVEGIEALEQLDRAEVEGRIVFFNRRMERHPEGSGYRKAVAARSRGPAKAAPLGAVAVLIRSAGTSTNRFAHTGGTRYAEGVRKIPAAALSNTDADLLERQLATGEPVRFRLELGCRTLADETSANVIGEVRGREKPEEIVLLAAHLDSWDLGTGAMDDGAGCAIVSETARLIAAAPRPPRRTLRVMLTANEEYGLSGARAYGELHAGELARHVAALESDFGIGRVSVFRARVGEEQMPLVRDLERLLAPLGVALADGPASGGADLRPLEPARVPLFDLPQDATRYFDYHHTADDTLDKLSPEDLRQNVAAYVTAAWVLAETELDLGRTPVEESPAAALPARPQEPAPPLATAILAEQVALRSTAAYPREIEKAVAAVAARLAAAGFAADDVLTVHPEPHLSGLVARYRGTGSRRPLLLMAHIDVVEAEPEGWSFDPFTFAERDGYYYGRGSIDNKAGVATLAANFIRLRREGFVPDRDLIMVLTGDEETDGRVIDWMVNERRELVDAELALNTDAGGGVYDDAGVPQMFVVQTAEKLYQSYRLTVTNPGGHSSLPRPDNAIFQLAAALGRLAELRFGVRVDAGTRLFFERAAAFHDPPVADDMRRLASPEPDLEAAERLAASSPYFNSIMRTTCVPTSLAAGHAENALPRSASAVVNCRILPGVPDAEVEASLRRALADDAIAIEKLWDARPSPPSPVSPEMMATLEELVEDQWPGAVVLTRMSTGATDGLFVRNAGIPVLGVSAIFENDDDVRAHGLDERVGVKELHDAVEFWYRLLKRLSS